MLNFAKLYKLQNMKTKKLLMYIAVLALSFTACKKEGDTIVNNYGSSDEKYPARTMLKGYGDADKSQNYNFTYQNDEIGKLKELTLTDALDVASAKLIILYNGSNQPAGYQVYTLPVNTLSSQGTFKVNSAGQIITSVQRKVNGDTTGIAYFEYGNVDYQPISFRYYDQSTKRYTVYEYFTYDKSGNMTKAVQYKNNGTDPAYKSSETEASGYGKGINGLNQAAYYWLGLLGASYGYGSSAPLYFSSYLPSSTRTQSYKVDGTNSGVDFSNFDFTLDDKSNVTFITGAGSDGIYLKY
jgi:hypothetical protein